MAIPTRKGKTLKLSEKDFICIFALSACQCRCYFNVLSKYKKLLDKKQTLSACDLLTARSLLVEYSVEDVSGVTAAGLDVGEALPERVAISFGILI